MTKYLFQGEALNAHMLVVLAKNAYDSAATMHLFDLDALDDGESDAPNQATLCGFLPKGGLTEAAPSRRPCGRSGCGRSSRGASCRGRGCCRWPARSTGRR